MKAFKAAVIALALMAGVTASAVANAQHHGGGGHGGAWHGGGWHGGGWHGHSSVGFGVFLGGPGYWYPGSYYYGSPYYAPYYPYYPQGAFAPMSPPDTGASRDRTPFDSSFFAFERAEAGLMVELSTKTSPL